MNMYSIIGFAKSLANKIISNRLNIKMISLIVFLIFAIYLVSQSIPLMDYASLAIAQFMKLIN